MNSDSILIIGTPQSGKKTLIKGIQDLFSCNYEPLNINENNQFLNSYKCDINTKYYNTSISFILPTSPDTMDCDTFNKPDNINFDGIFLLYDSNNINSFDNNLQNWLNKADEWDCSLRLCIANKIDLMDDTMDNEVWNNHRFNMINLCLDHGFEFVEAEAINYKKGIDDRDKEGVPRIMEAMQSTIWSSIDLSNMNKPITSDININLDDIKLNKLNINNNNNNNKEDNNENEIKNDNDNNNENESLEHYFNDPNILNNKNNLDMNKDDIETNKIFDEIEQVMDDVKNIREKAKIDINDNSENINNIRRKRAEDMAMKLLQMLDNMDDSDDDN